MTKGRVLAPGKHVTLAVEDEARSLVRRDQGTPKMSAIADQAIASFRRTGASQTSTMTAMHPTRRTRMNVSRFVTTRSPRSVRSILT
jgi:hypothetical protein